MKTKEELEQQHFISELWKKKSSEIGSTSDELNLTALVCGDEKHQSEIQSIRDFGLMGPEHVILDLACGNGRLCKALHPNVKRIVGTDLCSGFIESLQKWKKNNKISNVDFYIMDLLTSDYRQKISWFCDVIFLFGTTQFIVSDEDLKNIFKNIRQILSPKGKCLIKQTTSILQDDVFVDQVSSELKERWVAKYRTQNNFQKLAHSQGLQISLQTEAYRREYLGKYYDQIERWDNTRQFYFMIEHQK